MSAVAEVGRSASPRPVVLLQPPGTCRAFTRSNSSYPPLGLCQVAAVVDPSLVEVIDADALEWTFDRTLTEVLQRKPLAVGMTATSFTLELVQKYAQPLHDAGVAVLVGGPHASLAPFDLFARCPAVDLLVRGEGEVVFAALVDSIVQCGGAHGLSPQPGVWVRGRPVPIGDEVLRVSDMASVPMPRLTGLPFDRWWCPDARRTPMVTMMTTRGCPMKCGFCSSPTLLGRTPRAWPVAMVLDELERLQGEHAVQEISFVDDVFPVQRRRTIELCRGMMTRRLDLTWFCNARADQITPELAEAMASAGCHQVYLGFESGAQRILEAIDKGTTVERLEEGARILKEFGISRSVGFVVGLPGENDESVTASIELAHRVQPERLQFTRFTPLPGSPLADESVQIAGFHTKGGADAVGVWIQKMYAACGGEDWGRESW